MGCNFSDDHLFWIQTYELVKLPSSILSDKFRRDKKSRLQSVADELEIPLQKVLVANHKGLWMINEWLPSRNMSSLDLFRTWTTDKKSLTKLNVRFVTGDISLVNEIVQNNESVSKGSSIVSIAKIPKGTMKSKLHDVQTIMRSGINAQLEALSEGTHTFLSVTPEETVISSVTPRHKRMNCVNNDDLLASKHGEVDADTQNNTNIDHDYITFIQREYQTRLLEHEVEIQLQQQIGGVRQYRLDGGVVDLMTDEELIEIKVDDNYKHAIGQLVVYSNILQDHSRDLRMHLFSRKHDTTPLPTRRRIQQVLDNLYSSTGLRIFVTYHGNNPTMKHTKLAIVQKSRSLMKKHISHRTSNPICEKA